MKQLSSNFDGEKQQTIQGQGNRSQNISDEVPGLAHLIWKYFESEMREALLEAEESLADDNDKRTEQLSNGKQVEK